MRRYLLKRMVHLVFVLIIVSVVIFAMIHLAPGDPLIVLLGERATTEQTRGTQHVLEAMDSVTMRVQENSNRAHEIARFSADLAAKTHTLMGLLDQFNIGEQKQTLVSARKKDSLPQQTSAV